MKDGSKACPFCGSRFTFESFELVDSMPAEEPCDGCVQLYAILAESARRKAEIKRAEPQAEMVDLSPSAILARLLGNKRPGAADHDYAKAAAGDRD